ncbi:hypothetical protein evm_008878 [Chilo suppressalis]|nr:hypothetical protein evm_008878 [Chilo suppressalis]
MGLPRFCSVSEMFADAEVDCFFTIMRKRYASLFSWFSSNQLPELSNVILDDKSSSTTEEDVEDLPSDVESDFEDDDSESDSD